MNNTFDYRSIKTFEDACKHLGINADEINRKYQFLPDHIISFIKLEIITKALNDGCDYVREWNAQDQYQVERPEFQLPTPTAAGQESYHVTRYIDIYLEDHRVGDQRTYQGMETADQWYDSQAL